jgi:twitching motility two-component system response regulator PilG
MMKVLLEMYGYETFEAVDGKEAVEKTAECHPDLILMDIMMPRLDGYQTCALIKNNPQFRATPVIMLSSKDGLFDKARGRIVGAEQYLTKPFTRDELLGAIHSHVGSAHTAG